MASDPPCGTPIVYLPGIHGDDSLAVGVRDALGPGCPWIPIRYPAGPSGGLDSLVEEVLGQIRRAGVPHGWLLAESFGSQVAWALLERLRRDPSAGFRPCGLVLAGGFVRHPMPWAAECLGRWGGRVPVPVARLLLGAYRMYGTVCFAHDRSRRRGLDRFCRRRLRPEDRAAVAERLRWIAAFHPGPLAAVVHLPVHALHGLWDPIVPWPPVVRWLAHHCPGWRGGRLLWGAGHAVLVERPGTAARILREWIRAGPWDGHSTTTR